ncbi:hypothetical protein DPMN_088997 [Dreissena polymorpha]|uniref:Uncharacterized protein n=1 Tax=Dreissena polymorpha TaxID=45954 RepID=A0A9D4KV47_DREPO|nr:hypothetical protein DPMN_088997 [Dreissena polymorpha]
MINRAEARAAKKKKAKSTKRFKPSATVTSGSLPRGGNTFSFPVQSSDQNPCSNCILFVPITTRSMQKTELVPVSLVEKPPT